VTVRLVAFARVRELLGASERELVMPSGTRVIDVWNALRIERPELAELGSSTRFARNGAIADPNDVLSQDDELAVLPPVGGG
jgi:molybdopterin converting factor small subunit